MYYVPVTEAYWRAPVNYVPIYTPTTSRVVVEHSNTQLSNDLTRVQRELADLREELRGMRLENETCYLCSSNYLSDHFDPDCPICCPPPPPPPPRREICTRSTSPVHYCSICDDYVIDEVRYSVPSTPPPRRPRTAVKYSSYADDKLSEYLTRKLELHRLKQRALREERPVWIPTAYKQDYPHRRWLTRSSPLSEP